MGAGSGAGAVTGGFFSGVGRMKADKDEIMARTENAKSLDQQANYIEAVGKRKISLLKREQDQYQDRQKSMMAKSGVSFDGSSIDFLAANEVEMETERRAVEAETSTEARVARTRAQQQRDKAQDVADWHMFNFFGDVMNGASGGARAGGSYD